MKKLCILLATWLTFVPIYDCCANATNEIRNDEISFVISLQETNNTRDLGKYTTADEKNN